MMKPTLLKDENRKSLMSSETEMLDRFLSRRHSGYFCQLRITMSLDIISCSTIRRELSLSLYSLATVELSTLSLSLLSRV